MMPAIFFVPIPIQRPGQTESNDDGDCLEAAGKHPGAYVSTSYNGKSKTNDPIRLRTGRHWALRHTP